MTPYVWEPTPAYRSRANVTRLADRHGLASIADLRRRSVEDVAWYWEAAMADLGIPFSTPYSRVLDTANGIEHPEWFVGGRLNVAHACVSRWAADPASAVRPAVIHETEDGRVRTLTYAELADQVSSLARGLGRLGIGSGDVVGLLLPMSPEAAVTLYAVASIGAIAAPLFSGFAPAALAARLQDAGARAVVVSAGTVRRRRYLPLRSLLDEALTSCPSVEHVIVVGQRSSAAMPWRSHEVHWADVLEPVAASGGEGAGGVAGSGGDGAGGDGAGGDRWPVPVESSHILLLAYTSGTTGRPKGAVHTHAGFLAKTASEVAYSFDVGPGSVFCWITDMGWIMGPLSIVGTHANGATLLLYEGSPDVPDSDRLWDLVERHGVTMLGVSPSLARAIRSSGGDGHRLRDLRTVHTIGSTGEPWDESAYDWLARDVFGSRVPIINFSGGTEVGGSFLAPYPVEPIKSCSLGGPSLGMDVDVVDASGRPVRGEVGELVCRQPWPSMTRGIWRDEERYLESYWSTFPGVWRHGDFSMVDAEGQWFVLGRSDDVMNVAGKRLAPAEVEAVIATHPAVAEVAAVGVPDPDKGEAVWAVWVAVEGVTEDVSAALRAIVANELGKPFAPARVCRVPQLPKTRSAKILRRAVRAAALGTDPGDLSGAENPEAVEEIRAALASDA